MITKWLGLQEIWKKLQPIPCNSLIKSHLKQSGNNLFHVQERNFVTREKRLLFSEINDNLDRMQELLQAWPNDFWQTAQINPYKTPVSEKVSMNYIKLWGHTSQFHEREKPTLTLEMFL